jgi:hypothetical protein
VRGALAAIEGSASVTLSGGSIPAHGSCTVTLNVTADCEGSYNNKLPANALQTDIGGNADPAVATMTVTSTVH